MARNRNVDEDKCRNGHPKTEEFGRWRTVKRKRKGGRWGNGVEGTIEETTWLCLRCQADAANARRAAARGEAPPPAVNEEVSLEQDMAHLFTVRIADQEWRERAACKDTPLPGFISNDPEEQAEALEVCAGCPVKAMCLQQAGEDAPWFEGVAGGEAFEARDDPRMGRGSKSRIVTRKVLVAA